MKPVRSAAGGLLAALGIGVHRLPGSLDLQRRAHSPSAGRVLEFVGPGGAGKTTVFDAAAGRLRARWFLTRHALQLAAPGPADPALEAIHRRLFFAKTRNAEDYGWDIVTTAEIVRYSALVMEKNLFLMSGRYPRGFALDEGICRFYPEEIPALPPVQAARLLAGRALVMVRPDAPETVMARHAARHAARDGATADAGRLRARVEKDMRLFDRLAGVARAQGCPVLTLRAEDPCDANAGRVLAFERALLAGALDAAPAGATDAPSGDRCDDGTPRRP